MTPSRRNALAYLVLVACATVAALLAACSAPAAPAETDASLHVTVSIAPQEYFVRRIAGDLVSVTVMVPPGADPHTYEPLPEQMRALARSDAYLLIGVGFEYVWMDRIRDANPNMRMVDTAQGVQRQPIAAHGHDDKEEAHAGEDDPRVLDPHIWLSPRLVKKQAQAIYHALAELDPAHEAEYANNLMAFELDIETLDTEIRNMLANVANRQFIVFHPSWGYFASDYRLEQIPVEIEGQEPSAADLARLITLAREQDIRVILAQPEFSTQAAQTIAQEIGGRVELISPLAPDWLENMRRVARTFAEVLSE